MRLSIEQAKKHLQGMHRLWLCDEWGQPYNSKQCKNCDSHDNCLDIVLSSGSMSDIAKDLLDTIEALQREKEALLIDGRIKKVQYEKIKALQKENEQLLETVKVYAESSKTWETGYMQLKEILRECAEELKLYREEHRDYSHELKGDYLYEALEIVKGG